jgi:hypothetical protein
VSEDRGSEQGDGLSDLRRLLNYLRAQPGTQPVDWLSDCLTAWEKERAEAQTQYGRGYDQGYGQACDGCTALKELNALRAAVEKVEGEMRRASVDASDPYSGADVVDDETGEIRSIEAWANALKSARLGEGV